MKNTNVIQISKISLFRKGKPIECKRHGTHNEWRESKKSNVQCLKCAVMWRKADEANNPITYILRNARQHAKIKKILFKLTYKDIFFLLRKQENKCAISGIPFTEEMFSIDKVNPYGNYTIDNIQLLTINVNRIKSNLPQDYFISLCLRIAENQESN